MVRRVSLILVFGATALVATMCSSEGDSLESAEVTAAPDNVLAAQLTVVADEPVQVDVTARSGDHEVVVPRTAEAGESHTIPVVGMRAERDYEIEVELIDEFGDTAGSDSVGFSTGTLPEHLVDFTVVTDAPGRAEGFTLVEMGPGGREGYERGEDPIALQQVVAVDSDGEVVWYLDTDEAMGDVRLTDSGRVQSINFPGSLRETDLLGTVTDYWQVIPEIMPWTDPEELAEHAEGESEAAANDATVLEADWVDLRSIHHEVFPMPNGNLLALSNTFHALTPEQREAFCPGDPHEFVAISDVVTEFTRDGEVLRTWDLWDVMDIDETPGGEMCDDGGQIANSLERDWTHGNSVVYDEGRDAVIVSNRHTSNIVAMPHGTTDGPQSEMLWSIGTDGTIPLEGDLPRYQHAVEVQDDGSLILYDNGNGRTGTGKDTGVAPYSRAVVYDVDDSAQDPAEWTATQRWEHRMDEVPGKPVFAGFLGDADPLANGNVLVTHGGIPEPEPEDDHNRCVVVEVVPDDEGGEVIWRLEAGSAERPVACYRSQHVPTLYAGPERVSR